MQDLRAFEDMADRIEAEMRRIGAWQPEPLPQATIDAGGAFGQQTMAYTQWLQFVLVPRLREGATGAFTVPPTSATATQAVREFDTWHEADGLTSLLLDLDRLVASSHRR